MLRPRHRTKHFFLYNLINRYLSRFFDCLANPNLSATLATDSLISTMVNGTVLNFAKRYKDNLSVIFYQWPNLHLGLDALSNQKILKGI